jgi:hypothetical protein
MFRKTLTVCICDWNKEYEELIMAIELKPKGKVRETM